MSKTVVSEVALSKRALSSGIMYLSLVVVGAHLAVVSSPSGCLSSVVSGRQC